MSNDMLQRMLEEAQASGHNNWVRIIAGAMDGLPECTRLVRNLLAVRIIAGAMDGLPECTRLVRNLLAEQDETHWSRNPQ